MSKEMKLNNLCIFYITGFDYLFTWRYVLSSTGEAAASDFARFLVIFDFQHNHPIVTYEFNIIHPISLL